MKEHNDEIYETDKWAGEHMEEIGIGKLGERENKFNTVLYKRLTMLTSEAAFTMHLSVPLEIGLE